MDSVKESEENFKRTQSFRSQQGPLFKYVKNVGPNLRSQLNTLKQQALGTKRGRARTCNRRGCKTCQMLIKTPFVNVGKKKVKLSEGSCKSYNICYIAQCSICEKCYNGRTIEFLHKRTSGHRHCYVEILNKSANGNLLEIDADKDLYQLGLHLHQEHGQTNPKAFDEFIKFGILEIVSPADIEKKEFLWMHRLNTFQPIGINY